ncbi:MAG: methyltransferase domain-containing protein [Bacteroidota bacterium]
MSTSMKDPAQDIDIEQIMNRLRAKLGDNGSKLPAKSTDVKDARPPFPQASGGITPRPTPEIALIDWDKITSRVAEAERRKYVWSTKPEMNHYKSGIVRGMATIFGKIFLYFAQVVTKPQQAFNTSILEVMHRLNESLHPLQDNLILLRSRLDDMRGFESELASVRADMKDLTEALRALPSIEDRIDRQIRENTHKLNSIPDLERHISYVQNRVEIIPHLEQILREQNEKISNLRSKLEEETRTVFDRLSLQGTDVKVHSDNLNSVNIQLRQIHEQFETVWRLERTVNDIRSNIGGLTSFEQRINGLTGRVDVLSNMERRLDAVRDAQGSIIDRNIKLDETVSGLRPEVTHLQEHLTKLMTMMVGHERRLSVILDEARRRLPHPFNQDQLEVLAHELDAMNEELYLAFENKYRGSRHEIKDRVKIYLPMVRKAGAGSGKQPILDVGCGRGEWLEVLKDEGLVAFGLDLSGAMVEHCRVLGLKAEQGDILAYLTQIKDESLGALTGFHIIEHLPFAVWIKVFDEALRVLKPGGVMIFETPNPENVIVGSNMFYMDPTHRNPLPSEMVKFMAEARGFSNVEILKLHPVDIAQRLSENTETSNRFNDHFYGPQDYAVIAWKG